MGEMRFNKINLQALKMAVFVSAWIVMGMVYGVHAQTPEEEGKQIAVEADKRDKGWHSGEARVEMILKNRQGQVSTRRFRALALEMENDGDKYLMIFDHPRDIKGTVFSSHTHIGGKANDQWLYLPALKRVKRIAANNKSGSWMGSEFAYEDIMSQEVENYKYKYIRDDIFNGVKCYVVERVPVDKKSGYSRHVVWYDKAEYRVQKNELYDKNKNELIKTLTFFDYKRINDYFRADKYHMVNHRTGRETVLIWEENKLKVNLNPNMFEKSAMVRTR